MKRKIALLDDWVSVPGSRNQERVHHVAQIAESLARMGYQVDIFTCQSNREMPEVDAWQETVRLIHVPVASTDSPENFSVELQDCANFMIDYCERQEKPYDLIHASFRSSGLVAAEIKSRLGIPFVVTFQSPAEATPHAHDQETGVTVIEEHIGSQDRVVWDADGIIALNLQDRQALISLYHADPTYIIQIPDQIDASNSYPSGWHAHAEMLAVFYEDVLAVRRVAILPQTSALLPWDREGLEWNSPERIDRVLDTAWATPGRGLEAKSLLRQI
ncbi:MAG TPA: glycosyltransferase [Anaerolineales bacterium]|nr:glycosyltransferase [Anaerolineales bacterium]